MAATIKARPFNEVVPAGVTVHYVDSTQCLAWYRNVQLILSLQPPNRTFMRRIVEGLSALERSCRQRPASFLIIRQDVKPPEEEARSYIRTELARSNMLAAAQVVEGSGFRGAAMRSALAMIQLAVRAPFPMRVFGDIPGACEWLAAELQWRDANEEGVKAFARVFENVRDAFTAQSGSVPE